MLTLVYFGFPRSFTVQIAISAVVGSHLARDGSISTTADPREPKKGAAQSLD